MQQLFSILYRFRATIIFILLQIVAIYFTTQNYSYHKSLFVNSSNIIVGGIYNNIFSIRDYMHLKDENIALNQEISKLKNKLSIQKSLFKEDSSKVGTSKYHYIAGKVIRNSYNKQHNFLTLDIGEEAGVSSDLAVINSKGVVGIVRNISSGFSTVLSVLNVNSRINVRLKNERHFGTMIWNGKDYTKTQIIDMPRQAVIKKGDTVVTGNNSAIFPEGVPVGIIDKVVFENKKYTTLEVLLFNDMTAIYNIQVIKNNYHSEQKKVEVNE